VIPSLSEWTGFLRSSDALIGLPLVMAGIVLILLGWRMWRISLAVTYALLGFAVVTVYGDAAEQQLMYGVVGGLVLAIISGVLANQAVCVLGGIVGAGISHKVLAGVGLTDAALWAATGLSLLIFSAIAFINRRKVVIVVTSFQGAVLLISGLAVFIMANPWFNAFFRGAANWATAIFIPFVVMVPTVIGCFLQVADIRRHESGK